MNEFYPEIEPFQQFLLDVGNDHQLYVEQCGNPLGQPVLFIHGGPGGGCSSDDRRFFDPAKYHIILFDQRGCGRSLPHGSLEQNETKHLVTDIEKIRHHLDIDKWHIFGGSWGSTLALVYAQHYPEQIKSLVLRGIFLGRSEDIMWTFTSDGGAARIFPDYWQDFAKVVPTEPGECPMTKAYDLMTGNDREVALNVARAWSMWEIRCCTLVPDDEFLSHYSDDDSCWTLARHEAHYMMNNCFLNDNQILENANKISDIPTIIVHGRYDIVCPFDNAWLLHQKLPKSKLVVSTDAGHASVEPQTKHHLIDATRHMLEID